ncbi:Hypp5102 [Branchiostoma lanceolatum]|uniref:Hypp5102 protein n=1 Tax=Branchiostoma lanceolatum TaxID=7740 RepID=A0A8K0ACE6_BRALA|nr:Hypp5102 [Branchiostoma lanceolatum]
MEMLAFSMYPQVSCPRTPVPCKDPNESPKKGGQLDLYPVSRGTIYPHNLSSHQLPKGRGFHKLAGLRGAAPVWPLLSGDERQLQVTLVVGRERGGRRQTRDRGISSTCQEAGGRWKGKFTGSTPRVGRRVRQVPR